jgi:glutamate N-acetyltransferase/amino-acid N-acetyltransferase
MTTDTVPKEATARRYGDGRRMAKGAAMLARDGDDACRAHNRRRGPRRRCDGRWRRPSRNVRLPSVDGCRSTNDTVIVLANGRAGTVNEHALVDALTSACGSLAEQMARDAEGATKLVRIRVIGARTDAEARIAARAVANSQLVQCSLNGEDAYWGRVLSELGASGAFIEPEEVDIAYSGETICRGIVAHDATR